MRSGVFLFRTSTRVCSLMLRGGASFLGSSLALAILVAWAWALRNSARSRAIALERVPGDLLRASFPRVAATAEVGARVSLIEVMEGTLVLTTMS